MLLFVSLLDSPFSIISCSSRSISRSKSVFDNHLNLVSIYMVILMFIVVITIFLVSVSSLFILSMIGPPMNNSILKLLYVIY